MIQAPQFHTQPVVAPVLSFVTFIPNLITRNIHTNGYKVRSNAIYTDYDLLARCRILHQTLTNQLSPPMS